MMNEVPSAKPSLLRNKAVQLLGMLMGLILLIGLVLRLAQRSSWTHYEGLDAVSAIAADAQGHIWAAGYQDGTPRLLLYPENGKPLEVSMPDKLTRTAPSVMMVDSQDRLWVGTEDGRAGMREANDKWTLFRSDPDFSIWEMVMDGQGQVWARSHRGPGQIDPQLGEGTFTFLDSGLADHDAVAIATDEQGQLWVLTGKRELRVLEPGGTWRTHTTVSPNVRNSIYGSVLEIDPQGQFWMTTHNGVGVLSPGGAWTEHPLPDAGIPLSMRTILADSKGRVWVAATIHGLFMYDPRDGWAHYTGSDSGLSGEVNALALDRQGQLWIGSSQGGLSKFVPETALPQQSLSAVSTAAGTILPVIFLSLALLSMWGIAFGRPGAANARRLADISIAFTGWFLLNSLLWIYIRYSHEQSGAWLIINPLVFLPLPVNIFLMVVLFRWQRWMVFGAFSAFLLNWILLILVHPASNPLFWQGLFMIPFFLSL